MRCLILCLCTHTMRRCAPSLSAPACPYCHHDRHQVRGAQRAACSHVHQRHRRCAGCRVVGHAHPPRSEGPLPVAQVAASDPNPVRVCQDDGYQYCTLAQAAVSNAHDHAALPQPARSPPSSSSSFSRPSPPRPNNSPRPPNSPSRPRRASRAAAASPRSTQGRGPVRRWRPKCELARTRPQCPASRRPIESTGLTPTKGAQRP